MARAYNIKLERASFQTFRFNLWESRSCPHNRWEPGGL